MKKALIVALLLSASAMGIAAQTQTSCRDISGGGFLQPDEVLIQTTSGYMACRAAKPAAQSAPNSQVLAAASAPSAPVPAAKAPLPNPTTYNSTYSDERSAPVVQGALGYQFNSVNGSTSVDGFGFTTSRVSTNGAFGQLMVNVNRYISPVGSLDFSYKNDQGSNYLLTYLGGVQAYPLTHGRWSPFARAMFGAGTIHISGYSSETGFAWQVGGGLDWKPRREGLIAFRLGTFDYARVSKDGVNLNSLKIGTGIVF